MNQSSLRGLTAADIMQTDIVTVGPRDTLRDAMTCMTENHVTGLPVLDPKDRCIGVITTTDILNYEQDHAEDSAEANLEMARHFDPETQRWESIRVTAFALEEFADIPVGDLMTRELVAVAPSTPIRKVAKKMIDEEVRRVLVLNEKQYLLGIISSIDFVRLFAEL